ncbi:uncharacterized protein LOC110256296 isoform X4 [Sus scrofa]|uniref:uncharacterized protein LOC110256296 isoform X4 n=1 Tax=Sus scrofa TaxID=9823 RepID=UPI000A2B9865|nr:uncharacterized protein LOC110256296 isoform X4 [Sus scrofa]
MRGWRRWSWSQSSPPIGTWSPVSAERPWLGLGQTSAARVVTPGELWALPWGALRPGQDPWAQPRRGAAGAEECPTVLPPACPGATGPRVRLAAAASCTVPRGCCLALYHILSTIVLENTRRPDCLEQPHKAGTVSPRSCPGLLAWHPLQNCSGALVVQRKGQGRGTVPLLD